MARPTTHATPICLGVTALAAIGIVVGLATSQPIWAIVALLPAVGYEVYRTEGATTRWASWGLAAVFLAVLALIVFKVDLDLAGFFGESERTVGGYQVPLGDIKVAGSALMVVLSLILFTRTRGIYTRWLSVVILVSSLAVVYTLSPDTFGDVVRTGVTQGTR